MINFNHVLEGLAGIDNPNIQVLRQFLEGRVWCGRGMWETHVADLDDILKDMSNQELMEVAGELLGSKNTDVDQLVVWLMAKSTEVGKLVGKLRSLGAEDNSAYAKLRERLGKSEVAVDAIARWGGRDLKNMALEEIAKGDLGKNDRLVEKLKRDV